MRCIKNGVQIRFGQFSDHCYPADRYKCPSCGAVISYSNQNNFRNSDFREDDIYMTVKNMDEAIKNNNLYKKNVTINADPLTLGTNKV